MLYGLDLFSGIGGITLGLRDWIEPVAYCECDKYAQGVLVSRMATGDLPTAPIFTDITKLNSHHISTPIDIIYGGFPCQDISSAGHAIGLEGKRSGLFSEIVRLAKEYNPKFVFLENVPTIQKLGLKTVVDTFTEIGYDCRWTCVSAQEIGAKHKRERWFLLAYSKHNGLDGGKAMDGIAEAILRSAKRQNKASELERGNSPRVLSTDQAIRPQSSWETEPDVGRVADGIPYQVDRIRGLGNAVVPEQVKEAFKRLMGLK